MSELSDYVKTLKERGLSITFRELKSTFLYYLEDYNYTRFSSISNLSSFETSKLKEFNNIIYIFSLDSPNKSLPGVPVTRSQYENNSLFFELHTNAVPEKTIYTSKNISVIGIYSTTI